MNEEPKFLIGEHIYRINNVLEFISQVGQPENKILFEQLIEHDHSYEMKVNIGNGQLIPKKENAESVRIPKSIFEGYAEQSVFAERFNHSFSEKMGISLIDKANYEKIQHLDIPLPEVNFPTIEIGSFTYEIDVSLFEMRQVDQPFNTVSFRDLEIEKGKYQIFTDNEGVLGDYDYLPNRYQIDQLVKLVPEEVAKVYGISKDRLPHNDKDLRSHPDFIVERIEKGKLPIIRIVDEDYYIDARMEELRSCSDPFKRIILEEYSPRRFDENDTRFVYFYDILNRTVNLEYGLLTELPKHHVFIVLPDMVTLDPVSAGRKYCNDPTALLDSYPLQNRMEARIVLPHKTFLPELIKENKKIEQEISLKKENSLKNPGKRNGLGM